MSKLYFHQCFGAFALAAIVCLMAGQSNAALIHHYGLNETVNPSTGTTAVDATGNQNGMYAGTAGPVVSVASANASAYGTAVDFNGTDDVVTLGAGLGQLTNNFSIAAWIKPDELDRTGYIIASDTWPPSGAPNGTGWGLFLREATTGDPDDGDKLDFIVPRVGGRRSTDAFLTAADLGKWTHLAVTVTNDAGLDMYKNGQLFCHIEESITPTATDASYWIGCGFGAGDGPWLGGLDEVRIYDHVLSGSEVAQLAGVPEPSSIVLMVMGMFSLLAYAWRKRK